MADFEKLGVFYLGRKYDPVARETSPEPVLYDSRDLVTHAVCVGMTGSGKTGLGIALLEEAALDGIPAIVIDPKGDLANLLLTFPDLRPEDFQPWVEVEDAQRRGQTVEAFAAEQASRWREGLAAWGQDGERIRRLRAAAEFKVYTPGSTAGEPISILASFAAPDAALVSDDEALHERVATAAASLLGLLGIDADPLRSREHILLATLFAAAWRQGQDLPLATLIQQIRTPPVTMIGAVDVETFFPAAARFELAMALNNLLAAPGFGVWLQGTPLDVGQLLYTPAGRPRVAILSIAHLDDTQRMFFVSLLLNEVLGWMRAQPGTASLRAVVYMDEIMGYFPPVANPPSKRPLLTLLKQGRAFGVGIVLATQNPVDLDYKGLANCGTWFIGRLQTERDKARMIEGLEGAAGGGALPRAQLDQILSGLGKRVFLLHNVHDEGPQVFQVRWAMSYLRGPLSRQQLRLLASTPAEGGSAVEGAEADLPGQVATVAPSEEPGHSSLPAGRGERPLLPPDVPQWFAPAAHGATVGDGPTLTPWIWATAQVYFRDAKTGIDQTVTVTRCVEPAQPTSALDWQNSTASSWTLAELAAEPPPEARYQPLPPAAAQAKSYVAWQKSLVDYLYRTERINLWSFVPHKLVSQPGESEREFRLRVGQLARETRDVALDKIRQRYAARQATLAERRRRAEGAVDREAEQAAESRTQTTISFGATVLGALLGRKKLSTSTLGRAATAARGARRSVKEQQDVARAEDTVLAILDQERALEEALQEELAKVAARWDAAQAELTQVQIKPKKADIQVGQLALVWTPQQGEVAGSKPVVPA